MKKLKLTLSSIIIAFAVLLILPLCGNLAKGSGVAVTAEAATYKVGDHIQYGNYPQSQVTDSSTLKMLNSKSKKWVSYNYYSGSGSWANGKMVATDYMYYADIDTDDDGFRDYRAVKFDKYRQCYTSAIAGFSDTYQDVNGFKSNNIYYFRYEPIIWRILDPSSGLIMTETILDSQAYNNYILNSGTVPEDGQDAYWGNFAKTYYASDYYNSSIRQWLNSDFYNTAFTSSQTNNIRNDITLDNSCSVSNCPQYNSMSSKDKIFLISYTEAINTSYGFKGYSSSNTRQAQGTDYAKCQGLYVLNGNSWWWLRSSTDTLYVDRVDDSGDLFGVMTAVHSTYIGVRPACRLSILKSDISKSLINNNIGSGAECLTSGHTFDSGKVTKAASCTMEGITIFTCTNCKTSKIDPIAKLGHNYSTSWTIDKKATCTTDGSKSKHCTRCDSKTSITSIAKLGHSYSSSYTTDKKATCTTDGSKSKHCTRCDSKTSVTAIAKLGHDFSTTWTTDKKATCSAAGSKSHHCTRCNAKADVTAIAKLAHKYDEGKVTKASTCTVKGVKTFTCTVCKGTKTEAIALKAHKYSSVVTKATTAKDGKVVKTCSVCKKSTSAVVPKVSSITIASTTYTYNGSVKTPGVTVKDSKGKVLKNGTDYTVTYSSGRKEVGSYTAKVTLKGNYSGSKTMTFKITLGKVTGLKQTSAKGIGLSWSAVSGASGYEVVLTTNNGSTTKTTLSSASAKGSAKVKVRAYRTVNGKKVYGAYSSTITAKAK